MTRPLPSTIEAFQAEGKLADKARQEYPEPEHKGIGVGHAQDFHLIFGHE
jgi:hypothetical protein